MRGRGLKRKENLMKIFALIMALGGYCWIFSTPITPPSRQLLAFLIYTALVLVMFLGLPGGSSRRPGRGWAAGEPPPDPEGPGPGWFEVYEEARAESHSSPAMAYREAHELSRPAPTLVPVPVMAEEARREAREAVA